MGSLKITSLRLELFVKGTPSPLTFFICSKGLSGLVQNVVDNRHVEGFSLCRNGPKISHLFFADDSLLFCRVRVNKLEKNTKYFVQI